MLWLSLALMCLLATGFAVLPLTRNLPRSGVVTALTIIFVVGLSSGLYYLEGRPEVPSGASEQPDVGAMIGSLEERLKAQPDDTNGWKMLGRSYMALGNYPGAVEAYEKAVALEDAQNAETLVSLGVALAQIGGQQLSSRAIAVFENALALAPNHPEALFWAGIGAFNRGDPSLAADRWEKLLATNPPDEVRNILVERISLWRGSQPAAAPDESASANSADPVISVNISISDAARAGLPEQATVFVIARDPNQPSPPIAVTRRTLADLPEVVSLGDKDSMLPGRNLSAFAEIEIVVRASASGNPAAAAGDWFGSARVQPADVQAIDLAISEQVE